MMVSTFWVSRQCDKIIASNRYEIHELDSKDNMLIGEKKCIKIQPRPSGDYFQVNSLSKDSIGGGDLPMETVLADDHLIDLFARHLSQEFCTECLLSLIEFEQFKTRAVELLGDANSKDDADKYAINFAPTVPDSHIVFGNKSSLSRSPSLRSPSARSPTESVSLKNTSPLNVKRDLKERAYKLYNKYIESGSEFEVNIGSQLKASMSAQMSDYAKWMELDISSRDLCKLFDEAISEMTILLRSSKDRFQIEWSKQVTPRQHYAHEVTSI